MAIKEIVLKARQFFGGKWYPPGRYTKATFMGETYANGDAVVADKMWAFLVYKAGRHPNCSNIQIITDKPAAEDKSSKNKEAK